MRGNLDETDNRFKKNDINKICHFSISLGVTFEGRGLVLKGTLAEVEGSEKRVDPLIYGFLFRN